MAAIIYPGTKDKLCALKVRLPIEVWHGSLYEEGAFGERRPRRDFPTAIWSTLKRDHISKCLHFQRPCFSRSAGASTQHSLSFLLAITSSVSFFIFNQGSFKTTLGILTPHSFYKAIAVLPQWPKLPQWIHGEP